MALGEITELYQYRTLSIRDGIPTRTRGFRVEGLIPEVAVLVPNIPRYRDPHPDEPGLIARDITPTAWGVDSLIQVTYSPEPYVGGSGPSVNTYDEDFIGKDVSFEYEDVTIPLFRKSGLTTTDADGLPISQLVYSSLDSALPYRKRTPYYRVETGVIFEETPTIEAVFALTDKITAQVDRIHTIGDRDLIFACEGIDQNTANEFRVTYRWIEDRGIPNEWPAFDETLSPSGGGDGGLGRIGTTLYPFFDDDFIIPPFQGLRIDGNTDPTAEPRLTFFDRFKRDPNGWQTLPGLA